MIFAAKRPAIPNGAGGAASGAGAHRGLSRLSIGARLYVAFGIILFLLAVVVAVSLWSNTKQGAASHAQSVEAQALSDLDQLKFRVADINGWQTAYAFDIDRGVKGAALDTGTARSEFLKSAGEFQKEWASLAEEGLTTSQRADLDEVKAHMAEFMAVDAKAIALYRRGDEAGTIAANKLVMGQEISLFNQALEHTNKLDESLIADLDGSEAEGRAIANESKLIIFIASGIALLVGIVLVWMLRQTIHTFRGIVHRVRDASEGQTRAAGEMSEAAGQTGIAVGQIAATVEDIARGASEQAESTQQVTITVEEMVRGVAQVAEGGQAAATAASEADEEAARGAAVVGEATEAMDRISRTVDDAAGVVVGLGEKGQAIGEIVGTIDRIASQTNLLALNAAIEAARAGEQGRGFAVVAEEVRQLAEESQTAAASISKIIHEIQEETGRAVQAMNTGREEVATGVDSVARAGNAFTTIRERVDRVVGDVSQVAAAAQELEAGAGEVQTQIASVAAVSQENAAAAEEVSASTEETSAASQQVSATAATLASDAQALADLVAGVNV